MGKTTTASTSTEIPKKIKPRVVYWQGALDGRVVRKALVCNTDGALYNSTSTDITIDGVPGSTTGRRGGKVYFHEGDSSLITFIDDLDLREDYFWLGGDILAQIAWELTNNPTSCFSRDTGSWYNSLYSELGQLDDCSYRLPDPEVPLSEEIVSTLVELGQEVVTDILVSYLTTQFTGLPPSELNKYLNALKKGVE